MNPYDLPIRTLNVMDLFQESMMSSLCVFEGQRTSSITASQVREALLTKLRDILGPDSTPEPEVEASIHGAMISCNIKIPMPISHVDFTISALNGTEWNPNDY